MAEQDTEKKAAVFAIIIVVSLLLAIAFVVAVVLYAALDDELSDTQVDRAAEEIPPHILSVYKTAPSCSAIPWQVLAGIGKEESLHGTKYLSARGDISYSRQVATDGTVGEIVPLPSAFTQEIIDNSELDSKIKDGLYGLTTGSDDMVVKEISVKGDASGLNKVQIRPVSFEDVTEAIPSSETFNASLSNRLGQVLPGTEGDITLDKEGLLTAQYLLDVGDVFSAPPRAKIIALSTALVEFNLKHRPEGDRDSVGMLQQRPSQGWGTIEQIMDRRWAAYKFYDDLFFKMPERQGVASWTDLPPGVAAQEVQRSALPDEYAKRMDQAEELYKLLGGVGGLGTSTWTPRQVVMIPESVISAVDLPSDVFTTYGVDYGDDEGKADPLNYFDGIATLANFLCKKAPNPEMISTGNITLSLPETDGKAATTKEYNEKIEELQSKKIKDLTFGENLQIALHTANPDASFAKGAIAKANYYTPQGGGSVGDISSLKICSVGDDGMVPINTYVEAGPGIIYGAKTEVCPEIKGNIQAMLDAAANDGIALSGWAHRPNSRQIALRAQNCANIWDAPSSSCSPPTAKPGRSMHEQGLAMDITYKGSTIQSRGSKPFLWLQANASKYGFKNLPSEPWHWSVNGK